MVLLPPEMKNKLLETKKLYFYKVLQAAIKKKLEAYKIVVSNPIDTFIF